MIIEERTSRNGRVIRQAENLLTAVRTAPKGRGVDIIEAAVLTGDDIKRLSDRMLGLHSETGKPVFLRDGKNILDAEAILVIGTEIRPLGLNCGHCGFPDCVSKPEGVPCFFNSADLGIALGSAAAAAADMRLDTRIMYSAGIAAQSLGILGENIRTVLAIAVSASSKNPFFDR